MEQKPHSISSQGQHYIHEPYYFTDKYIVSVGYERDIGYTYDEKKHWVFDPAADTVFFRLQRAPSYTPQLLEAVWIFPYRLKLVFLRPVCVNFPQNSSLFLEKFPCQTSKILRLVSKHQNPNSL